MLYVCVARCLFIVSMYQPAFQSSSEYVLAYVIVLGTGLLCVWCVCVCYVCKCMCICVCVCVIVHAVVRTVYVCVCGHVWCAPLTCNFAACVPIHTQHKHTQTHTHKHTHTNTHTHTTHTHTRTHTYAHVCRRIPPTHGCPICSAHKSRYRYQTSATVSHSKTSFSNCEVLCIVCVYVCMCVCVRMCVCV